jgi:hypothetical protein
VLKDYFGSTSCPGSPALSNKHPSATSTPATLSPPGIPPTPTSTLSGSGKRRGIGHRASYKRAHTGRLVCIHTVLFSHPLFFVFSSLLIIHQMNYLLNYKNYESMKIMNTIGMNVQGMKIEEKSFFEVFFFLLLLLNRWIRYEEDFDVEMQRWQGLFSFELFNHSSIHF